MESPAEQAPTAIARTTRALRDHPVITGVMDGCIVVGTVAGAVYLSGDWSLARRLAAGGVSGAGIGICVCGIKMIG